MHGHIQETTLKCLNLSDRIERGKITTFFFISVVEAKRPVLQSWDSSLPIWSLHKMCSIAFCSIEQINHNHEGGKRSNLAKFINRPLMIHSGFYSRNGKVVAVRFRFWPDDLLVKVLWHRRLSDSAYDAFYIRLACGSKKDCWHNRVWPKKLPVYWWINRRLHNCGEINVLWGAPWPALWEIALMATFGVLHCHVVSANTSALIISNLRETVLFTDIQLYTHALPNADQRDNFLPITTNNALARKIPAAKWPIWSRSSRSLLNFINSIMWIYSSAGE